MLRISLLGVGYWGTKLLRVFTALQGVQVALVADLDPRRLEDLRGSFRVTSDIEEAWEDETLDAVVVATPPSSHYTLAREILRARRHCWVEKPLALSVPHASELVELARQNDRVLFVDETFLYDPLIRLARQWIHDQRLGRLFHLSFDRLGMGRIRRDSDVWWNSASHDLSILRYIVPAEVLSVAVESSSYLQPGIADICHATIRLAGGSPPI